MKNNLRTYAFAGSIILHILLFFAWASGLLLFVTEPPEMEVVDPIVLDLQQPPEKKKPTQVIETPEDAKITKNPEDADYLSDKNALASNEQSAENLPVDQPFARGDLHAAELPVPRGPRGEGGSASENPRKQQQENADATKEAKEEDNFSPTETPAEFSRDLLVKNDPRKPGQPNSSLRARYGNEETRALENAKSLSFNTYDWEFAPYMIWLKRRVDQNIFPPPAFMRMGIIDGETVLRFRIYPDGRLENLEVVGYEGHKTLMETSYRAIQISAPFKSLPSNFPEEYLEVTARFKYTVNRGR